jgi:hypothetical protein
MNALFEPVSSGVMTLRTEFSTGEFLKHRILMRKILDIGVATDASKITMKGTHRHFMTPITRQVLGCCEDHGRSTAEYGQR